MVDIEKIEKACLRRIETAMNYEKDQDLRLQIAEAGRAICTCMAEQSTKERVIHKVMITAAKALPSFTVTRKEKEKLV